MPGGRNPSIEVIQSWPTPNYTSTAETQGPALSVLTWTCVVLVPIFVGARIYARWFIIKKPGLDDYVFLAAVPFIMGFNACVILMGQVYGFGHHIWDVPKGLFVSATEINWFGEILLHIGSTILKISILLFYRRLTAAGHSTMWLWIVRIAITFFAMWGFAFTIVNLMACNPIQAYWLSASWDPYTQPFTCLREDIYWPMNGAMSVITDIITVLIPCCMVANLKTTLKQKRLLYALFSLGFLTAVIGVVRLAYTVRVLWFTYDTFWEGYPLILASVVELNFGVLLGSGPALKPIFSHPNPNISKEKVGAPKETPYMNDYSSTSKLVNVGSNRGPSRSNSPESSLKSMDVHCRGDIPPTAIDPAGDTRDDVPVQQYAHTRDISTASTLHSAIHKPHPQTYQLETPYYPSQPVSPSRSVHFDLSQQPKSHQHPHQHQHQHQPSNAPKHKPTCSNLSHTASHISGISSIGTGGLLSPVPSNMNVSVMTEHYHQHDARLDEPLPPLPEVRQTRRGTGDASPLFAYAKGSLQEEDGDAERGFAESEWRS